MSSHPTAKKYNQVPLLDQKEFASHDVSDKHREFLFEGDVEVHRTAGIFSSFINLTNTIIGSGVLGLPFAFANTGWILGSVLMLLAGAATVFSLHLLAACALNIDGAPSMYSVTELTMPKFAGLVDLAVVISCFGAATSYLIVIGDLMPEVLSALGASGVVLNRQLWVGVGFAVVAPLSCLKSLDALKYTSVASVLFVVFLTGIIIAFASNIPGLDPCEDISAGDSCVGSKDNFVLNMETARVFSIFVFAFTCQQNIFGIAAEIKDPSLGRLNIVIYLSIAVAFIIYIVVAACGYSTYGANVDSNILVSYPGDPLITVARVFVTALVAFSYPLQAHPARAGLLSLYAAFSHEKEENLSNHVKWIRYVIVTGLFLGLTLAISMSVSDLSIILSFVGATGSTLVSFILPGFAYYIMFEGEGFTIKRSLALLLGIIGLIIVPVCLTFIFV